MAVPEAVLRARARQAYERGRATAGLRAAAVALPLAAVSGLVCGAYAAVAAGGTLLALALGTAAWRGEHVARGARAGLWAGLGPFLLPVAVQCSGPHACGSRLCLFVPAVCAVGGLAAGAVVAAYARDRARHDGSPLDLSSALAVATLTGSLGCVVAGLGGVVGMALGLVCGAAPVLWIRARPA